MIKAKSLKRPEPAIAIKNVAIILLVGIIGFAIPLTHVLFQNLTPLVIILGVLGLIFYHDGDRNFKFFAISLFVLLAGFFVEVLGVKTGLIFGHYKYGTVLGPKVLDTPLMIGVLWLLLVYCARSMVEYWDTSEWIKIILVAVLVTTMDIVLEPVAIALGFWTWDAVQVPLQNYIAWFVIALIFSALFSLSKVKIFNEMGAPLFFLLFLFFILLNVVILFLK